MMKYQALTLLLLLTKTFVLASDLTPLNDIVKSENVFANNFSFFIHKHHVSDNIVSSPLSAYFLLSELAYGAGGQTAKNLHEALLLPKSITSAHKNFENLRTELANVKDLTLNVANLIVPVNDVTLNPLFLNRMNDVFGPHISNFTGPTEKVIDYVNNWVDSETHHKISEILTKGDVDADTALILLNAFYFEAQWKHPFLPYKNLIFTGLNKEKQSVKVMLNVGTEFVNGKLKNFDADFIELPYENEDFKMVLFVPSAEEINVRDFEKLGEELRLHTYDNLPKKYTETSAPTLVLPKFKFSSLIDLYDVSKDMHIDNMFTSNADFSVMSDTKLKVSRFIQKVFIDVNEVGTVGAAAAASQSIKKSGTTLIRALKPFYFSLESKYGVLFRGQVTMPKY